MPKTLLQLFSEAGEFDAGLSLAPRLMVYQPDDLLSPTQVAEEFNSTRQAVCTACRIGTLPAQRVGHGWAIRYADARRWARKGRGNRRPR